MFSRFLRFLLLPLVVMSMAIFLDPILLRLGYRLLLPYDGTNPQPDLNDREHRLHQRYLELMEDPPLMYSNDQTKPPRRISVMSFNIRLDAEERDQNNHFTRRVFRLNETLMRWQPALVGLQEPFGPQVHHLLSTLPHTANRTGRQKASPNDAVGRFYAAVGERVKGIKNSDLLHPKRHNAFQCGILYRPDLLQLVDQEYHWLSETPTVPYSKSWGSMGVRTVNIAAFRMRKVAPLANVGQRAGEADETEPLVVLFNTHLDVKSESARRGQSAVLRTIIDSYRAKVAAREGREPYIFVTGDFNSAPGQSAHRTLLNERVGQQDASSVGRQRAEGDTNTPAAGGLADMWEQCVLDGVANCFVDDTSHATFHGWLGSLVNSKLARVLHSVLLTFHAMEINVPLHVPKTLSEVLAAVKGMFTHPPKYPRVTEAIPSSFFNLQRFHVDWILASPSAIASSSATTTSSSAADEAELNHPRGGGGTQVRARFMAVGDVRDDHYSSDHFPVVGIFDLV